jgi:hypothetical protein
MSQFPRCVTADVSVLWDAHANGAQRSTFTRHGTVVDVAPGSLLEAAYGPSVLSGVIPLSQRGDGDALSKEAVSNLWQPTATS